MFLLDTDVLSFTSPVSAAAATDIAAWRLWVRENSDKLWFSTVTCMEISFGVTKARRRRPGRKAAALELWLIDVTTLFDERICQVTTEIACLAGIMLERAEAAGFAPSSEDALIAATAEVRGYVVLTGNGKDFAALGGTWRDPLDPEFLAK